MKNVNVSDIIKELDTLVEEYPPKRKTSNVRIKYPEKYEKLVTCTSFLPSTATTSQRIWHIRNNKFQIPTCLLNDCNNKTKWFASYADYATFCSKKCFNKHKTQSGIENNHKENIKKYGESYRDLSTYDKTKITNLKRYGYDNPFKNVNEIRRKNREKYGVDFHFQKHLSKDVLSKLNNKEWLIEMNHNQNKSCVEISDILGINNTTVKKAMYRLGITPSYNYSSSYYEKQLVDYVKSLGATVKENDRTKIYPFELDILIPEYDMAIEYCGLYWHNELHKDKNYHQNKLFRCNELGLDLLTIYEDEWHDKKDVVKNVIRYKLNKANTSKTYARECYIKNIDSNLKRDFFNETHIQGSGPSSINLGLFDKSDQLIAVMGLIKNNQDLILNRFSTKHTVPGGFSKLLSYVEKNIEFEKIVTFADLRWSNGNLYEKTGFIKDKMLPPDYYYVHNNIRYHKFNFRHSKLRTLFNDYDPNKSEHENCLNNNTFRLYDCGKIKYIYTKY